MSCLHVYKYVVCLYKCVCQCVSVGCVCMYLCVHVPGESRCLGFLVLCGEVKKRRSLWLVMGFGAIALVLLVSLLLNYPSPNAAKAVTDALASTGI